MPGAKPTSTTDRRPFAVERQLHFGAYVDALERHHDRVALTQRRFIAIEHETFAGLCARVRQTAHFLVGQGVQPGDRVVVVAHNSPEWVELLLGTTLVGAVLVAVDAATGREAVLGAVGVTQPVLAFCEEALEPVLRGLVRTVPLSSLHSLTTSMPTSRVGVVLEPQMPAVILFTSGTTADPKGVVLSHANLLANVQAIAARITVQPEWRMLSVLPLSHAYGLTGALTALAGGAQVVFVPQVTPTRIAKALVEFRITTVLAVPELLAVLLARVRQRAADEGKARLLDRVLALAGVLPFPLRRALFRPVLRELGGCLDLVVVGGAPVPLDVARAWEHMGIRTVQGYGLTETAPILTVNALHHRRLDSPGRALDNVELRIGADDEIQARGPNVFSGYWRRDEASKAAFTDDGWFRTGDAGRLEHGWLHIEGRLKFAIVRANGRKVFPEDVELVTEGNPAWDECCVVGVAGVLGESVVAVITGSAADDVVAAAIEAVNTQQPSFQRIEGWRRWPERSFPRTQLAKIDRRAVREWANQRGASGSDERPTEHTDRLARIIRANLDDRAAPFDDRSRLGDVGLGSLGRLNVVAMVEEQLGVSLAEQLVTPTTTVGELRGLIDRAPSVPLPVRRPRWPYWRPIRALGTALRESVIDGIVRVWVRTQVVGTEHLDGLDEPVLVIFNHSDDFDGPVVWRSLPPRLRRRLAAATAADVLAEHRVLAFLDRLCFAGFAFARTEPFMDSFEYVGTLVDRGWSVAIAPEGHLSTDGRLQPFKSGIGVLTLGLGTAVVPVKTVGLAGTVPLHARWPRKRSAVTVRIGAPLRFPDAADDRDVTATLREVMEAM